MALKFNFNAAALEASISNLATRAARGASEEMRKTAIKIRDLAREYAPRDTGALEDAIDYMTVKGANRRNVFVVYIDLDKANSNGGVVGDYAWIMEQQLHPYGRRSGKIEFNLDIGSLLKNAAMGGKVGGRFLERAMKDGSADMLANATAAVSRVLGGRLINLDYQRSPNSGAEQ